MFHEINSVCLLYLSDLLFRAKVRSASEKKDVSLIYPPKENYNYERLYTIHPHQAYLCSLNELNFFDMRHFHSQFLQTRINP